MTDSLRYIVIEGPIGVGKTTLCELLAADWNARSIFEEVEENPFLAKFYKDRDTYAFQTQIFFMLSRYRQQKELSQLDLFSNIVVSDYMFAKDRIFASVNLTEDEFTLYDKLSQTLAPDIPKPDLVVYLQGSVDSLLRRISHRDRPYEGDMSKSYLNRLIDAYNDYFFRGRMHPTLVVNTDNADFRQRGADFTGLLQAIELHAGGVESYVPYMGGRK